MCEFFMRTKYDCNFIKKAAYMYLSYILQKLHSIENYFCCDLNHRFALLKYYALIYSPVMDCVDR